MSRGIHKKGSTKIPNVVKNIFRREISPQLLNTKEPTPAITTMVKKRENEGFLVCGCQNI